MQVRFCLLMVYLSDYILLKQIYLVLNLSLLAKQLPFHCVCQHFYVLFRLYKSFISYVTFHSLHKTPHNN